MSGPASTLGGLSDSSQALMANTTAPATASTPNARRSRSAMGIVISLARARRWFTNWRADIATNTMTATTTVLSSTTAPCDDPNRLPLSRITIWTMPVITVTPIATLDSRPKPRTAWTRSSSPGPARTTRASSTTPPTHTAIARACSTPMAMLTTARSVPVRLNPMVTTARPGTPSANICVTGSITRSGRKATQAAASTNTIRARAAIPAVPASNRSSHDSGLKLPPSEPSVTAAVAAARYSAVPTNATIHAPRTNRTVSRYSTPSGQAAAITTSEPKSTGIPNTDNRRPSHSGPWPASTLASSATSSETDDVPSGEPASPVVVVEVPSTPVPSGSVPSVSGTVVSTTAGSFSTVKVMLPTPLGSPSVLLTPHRTTQVPRGSASTTSALSVRPSSPTRGRPMVDSSVLHSTTMVLTSPSSSAKVIWISAGESPMVPPSSGDELTTLFSAWAVPGSSVNAAVRPATSPPSRDQRRARRRGARRGCAGRGTGVRSFTIAPRLVAPPLHRSAIRRPAAGGDAHLGGEIVAAELQLADPCGECNDVVVAHGLCARRSGRGGQGPPPRRLVVGVAHECPVVVGQLVGHVQPANLFCLRRQQGCGVDGELRHRDLLRRCRQGIECRSGLRADGRQIGAVALGGGLRTRGAGAAAGDEACCHGQRHRHRRRRRPPAVAGGARWDA